LVPKSEQGVGTLIVISLSKLLKSKKSKMKDNLEL
jgi:hypothetical protein